MQTGQHNRATSPDLLTGTTCHIKGARGQRGASSAWLFLVMSLYPMRENLELLSQSEQIKVLKKYSREAKEQQLCAAPKS